MSNRTSRLAPSPTGALHLGNARTFLINWALARRNGWTLPMRIEDLDGPRIKAGAAESALDVLQWLGIDWDGKASFQSHDLQPYTSALQALTKQARAYSCDLSRSEIEAAASAPHAHEHELPYPTSLRPTFTEHPHRFAFDDAAMNYRFLVPDESVIVDDMFAGTRSFRPIDECGDFIIWTRRSTPAYQLAVVVDDHRQGVSDVVRGDDLLPSAARQQLLYSALGWPAPRWWHLPLVVGEDGNRLAKRHGDTRIDTYRAIGTSAERIIGLIAFWSGASAQRECMPASEFARRFDLARLSPQQIVFTEEDHRWLISTDSS